MSNISRGISQLLSGKTSSISPIKPFQTYYTQKSVRVIRPTTLVPSKEAGSQNIQTPETREP